MGYLTNANWLNCILCNCYYSLLQGFFLQFSKNWTKILDLKNLCNSACIAWFVCSGWDIDTLLSMVIINIYTGKDGNTFCYHHFYFEKVKENIEIDGNYLDIFRENIPSNISKTLLRISKLRENTFWRLSLSHIEALVHLAWLDAAD